jgi:hypothetical protein
LRPQALLQFLLLLLALEHQAPMPAIILQPVAAGLATKITLLLFPEFLIQFLYQCQKIANRLFLRLIHILFPVLL